MDASSFVIDGTGQIGVASTTTLDYEIKVLYTVIVSVSDGKDANWNTDLGVDDAIGVTIRVVDVEEDGHVLFSPLPPQVGEMMTARVMDPDNYSLLDNLGLIPASAVESWAWERSDNFRWALGGHRQHHNSQLCTGGCRYGQLSTGYGYVYRPEGTG